MASTSLTRTSGTSTNVDKCTFSAWVKRGNLSDSDHILMGQYTDANNRAKILISENFLTYFEKTGGSTTANVKTTRKFRDTSAWYHIVVAFDSTQGTAADRIKFYVNGVQETALSHTDYVSQNGNIRVNESSAPIFIGQDGNSGYYFDGSMSHVHFCDGTALAPTVFGSTDSTTGEWKINTSPSFTLGTNGFTILKDGNTITDQSANSNDFSLSSGTLTKTEDCPSNVFATWNPLWRSRFDNDGAFVNGNTKVTFQNGDTNRGYGISTIGVTKGKYYWEVKQITDDQEFIGVADANFIAGLSDTFNTQNPSRAIGMKGTNGNLYYNTTSNSSYHNTNVPANAIISIALDMDNYLMWYGINGTWLNNATASEIANGTATNDVTTAIGTKNIINNGEPIFPMVECESTIGQAGFEANFGNGYFGTTAVSSAGTNASGIGIFEYDVPTGYTALSTKGLNL